MSSQETNDAGWRTRRTPRCPAPKAAARVVVIQLALTLATSIWVMGYQRPPTAAVALHIALPWIAVAIAASFPKCFTLSLQGGDGRKPLSAAWFLNVISLVILFRCVRFVRWPHAFWVGCIPGVALLLVAVLVERRLQVTRSALDLMFLFLASVGCGYGMMRELDILLDHSPDLVVRATVLDKSKLKTWALHIAPWGAVNEVKSVIVPGTVFDSVQIGGAVCMVERDGAFGVPWYTAQVCPWAGGNVALGPEDVLPSL